MGYILAADLGTTSVKIGIFSEMGCVSGFAGVDCRLDTPSADFVESDPELYWQAFVQAVRRCLRNSGLSPMEIGCISFSAAGETLVCVDAEGRPTRPIIQWMDNRAYRESQEIEQCFGKEEIYRRTGLPTMLPGWPASKIRWIGRQQREVFERTRRYLLIEDYFIYRLTGEFVSEGSLLCSTGYWDIRCKTYWEKMLDFLELRKEQLPEFRESGTPIGKLTQKAAQELGLSSETMVLTGGLDQACGAIGAGAFAPSVVSENTGSALSYCAISRSAFTDPNGKIPCFYFPIPDTYSAFLFTSGGIVLNWFLEVFFEEERRECLKSERDVYERLSEIAAAIEPGCEGLILLPYLQGAGPPESDPLARGVFCGMSLRHRKAHFARALMESICYVGARSIKSMRDLGIRIQTVVTVGGGAKNAFWNQMKADIYGLCIKTNKVTEASAVGAAMLAAVGTGLYRNLEEAGARFVREGGTYRPGSQGRAYEKSMSDFESLYQALSPWFSREENKF